MSNNTTRLSDLLATADDSTRRIAYHDGRYVLFDEFGLAVRQWVGFLQAQPSQRYGLFTDDAYSFTILLFALSHACKEVWIPGNKLPGTAQLLRDQGCDLIGDWENGQALGSLLTAQSSQTNALQLLDPLETRLIIFTSGSSGKAKAIEKRLIQLQLEIDELENRWGGLLGNSEILSTISHQHIYGLLFRVLWPLSAGRCFHSAIYLNPEILANHINSGSACWVASPAHLKRLTTDSPWQTIQNLSAIFSSGGALPSSAKEQIFLNSGQSTIEVYGSTETGGIGWRQQEETWRLFSGMALNKVNAVWHLKSPYLFDKAYHALDDQLTLLENGLFILQGRSDRIVKIEEKRVSLPELEQRLVESPLLDEAHALLFPKKRDVIAAAVSLNEEGVRQLQKQGRSQLIRQLKKQLSQWLEPVALPRKWLFANALPLTSQGKIDRDLLISLIDVDKTRFPQVLSIKFSEKSVELYLKVPQEHELIYFPDHFPGYPILPGVIQLAWVEHFGKLLFSLGKQDCAFSHLEVVKFIQIIRPGTEMDLTLYWNANKGELNFNFKSNNGGVSSGRMVYQVKH